MILSIVTIAYNSERFGLEKTLHSVISEIDSNPDVEYVVIDGASTDGSSEIYNRYLDRIDFFSSEKDKGISDAFNKGVRHSAGKYIWFVNSGDYLVEGAILSVLNILRVADEDIFYGDMYWVSGVGKSTLLVASKNYEKKISYVMPFMHPSTLVSREVFEAVGIFDIRLKHAMDYDLFLRAHKYGFKAKKIDMALSSMTAGGVHDTKYHKTVYEVFRVSFLSGGGLIMALGAMVYTYLCQRSATFRAFKGFFKKQSS
ncbi:glycosyltransferase involved in cell wall biosynthesis [Pseudomonas marginalis]|uniref:glycosyltransferase family 2 protein n=1 Tax=Pseudomonas marginalis TaxID=298 RepID=UPI00209EDBA0|nr:glycosyltransferase family 2 protein [Pseudomonas marginalis]MCP1505543.1 glycosyltransferase involved in cell wall biosynthesis [Pseudomonas marginalis]MCP1523047.1 glycosyltransferase involved in cell wall biosynthesis [Pseudomonas marginalis]MDQ0497635.1 glycosyltransferase involved in cell wall biosynthesis [Pseudomonas marginalis]